MLNTEMKCKRCGSYMKQKGSMQGQTLYHCSSCGYDEYVALSTDDNSEYWVKRSALLGRIRKGIIDWEVTGWDYLKNDVLDFVASYEAAQFDIYFKIAIIACLTKGFHDMNNEKYRECKRLFKVTEKIYKKYLKDPEAKKNYASETGSSGVIEYEEYRHLYKKCLYDYRCTQFAWKVLFSVGKKIVPFGKFY